MPGVRARHVKLPSPRTVAFNVGMGADGRDAEEKGHVGLGKGGVEEGEGLVPHDVGRVLALVVVDYLLVALAGEGRVPVVVGLIGGEER